jgi:hypothetical protein
MGFNIADWKAYVAETGVLQTNKYDVIITLDNPQGMGGLNINGSDGTTMSTKDSTADITYRCISASIPGLTMRTADVARYGVGVVEKMPYSAGYTDVNLTFLMDRYGTQYNFWYAWFNYIFGVSGEETLSNIYGTYKVGQGRSFYTAEYKDNYSATVTITVYDNEGNPSIVATLLKAYPLSVNDVALSWTDDNNLVKVSVNLTFREWVMGDGQYNVSVSRN